MSQPNPLEWVTTFFGLEPRWLREPAIEAIRRLAAQHLNERMEEMQVEFFAQGCFNKLYKVGSSQGKYIFRVALPVEPGHKTRSEVATIRFVQNHTSIPVPSVIAFDSSTENELGLEWIMMEMMPGVPLRRVWRTLSMASKQQLVTEIAGYNAELLAMRNKFEGIGNIFSHCVRGDGNGDPEIPQKDISYPRNRRDGCVDRFTVGRVVSLEFFEGDLVKEDIPRGPFQNSREWLQARLEVLIHQQDKVLACSDDEDDIETATRAKATAFKMISLTPKVLHLDENQGPASVPDKVNGQWLRDANVETSDAPPHRPTTSEDDKEEAFLWHHDISVNNVLVTPTGDITAIVDWECLQAVPFWVASQLPQFLAHRIRDEEPCRDSYGSESEEEKEESLEDDEGDNEGKTSLYWIHLQEYERGQLREIYLAQMEDLIPGFQEHRKRTDVLADFEYAVRGCDGDLALNFIEPWLNDLEAGNHWSLRSEMAR